MEQLPSKNEEEPTETRGEYLKDTITKKLGREATEEGVERAGEVAKSLIDKVRAITTEHGATLDKRTLFKSMIDTLDEAHGNFNNMFKNDPLSWDQFLDGLSDGENVQIKVVKPDEYFVNVGNGLNVEAHRRSIELLQKTLEEKAPDLAKRFLNNNPKVATQALLEILDHPEYVYGILDKEMVEEARGKGKNHIASTRFQAEQLADGLTLSPPMVAAYQKSEKEFGSGIDKVILDGTHRTLVAAYANQPLYIIEVDMNRIKKQNL